MHFYFAFNVFRLVILFISILHRVPASRSKRVTKVNRHNFVTFFAKLLRVVDVKFALRVSDYKTRFLPSVRKDSYGWVNNKCCFTWTGCTNNKCMDWFMHIDFKFVFYNFVADDNTAFLNRWKCCPSLKVVTFVA